MTSIAPDDAPRKVIVGVDTHKHLHVAVAIDHHGARLGDLSVSADSGGYAQLEAWARALGRVDRFGIEGTGSYGAGLTSYLRRCGHRIIEVNRGDRRTRRQNGKSDTLDAEAAARSVLAGTARSIPKTADGLSEMIRQGESRSGHSPQGPDLGDHHLEADRRERAGGAARVPRRAS
jgi:transposase